MGNDSRSPRQGQDPPADPRDLADYSALDPLARHAWFLATLLMLRHWALGLVRRRADPEDDPRDLVQEALTGALRDWQAFVPYPDTPPFYALRGWFAGVLLNKCRMARRFRRTRLEVPLAGAKDSSEALRHPGHEGQVQARSVLRALRDLAWAFASKMAAGLVYGATQRWPWRTSAGLGALLNCRGVTEIAIASVGFQAGLIGPAGVRLHALGAVAAQLDHVHSVDLAQEDRPRTQALAQQRADELNG